MFWNYWWSLQSDWLLIVQFTHESHHFSKSQIAFLPGQWESFTKIQQPITFQGLFKITNQIVGKRLITFATFDKPAKYWINKILLQTKKPNIWTIECCSFKIEVIRGNWTLWHAIFIWNHSCVFTSNSHLILKSQVWFQSKYCTVLSSIAIIHCSVLLLCSWFLNTELKCSQRCEFHWFQFSFQIFLARSLCHARCRLEEDFHGTLFYLYVPQLEGTRCIYGS